MAGRGLGTLTLDLAIRMGAFEKGLDQAGRKLNSKMTEMERRADKFGRALGTAIKFALSAAVIDQTFGRYIRNTIEAEKVQAQLAARIKDTGAAAGRTLEQLSAQADKLQSLTVFDDESIGEAQAKLLTFTNVVGENFDRTIEAATDLATVMGTDVVSAAGLLGKALADPEKGMGALRKAGIALTEDQKFLIKAFQEAGDVAAAQDVILDALAGTMGTAAEAARNTLGGALEGLKNAFDNMLEGDSGSSGVRGATQAINDLAAQMNSAEVRAGFNTIVTGLASVVSWALKATAALTANSEANRQRGLDDAAKSYEGLLTKFQEVDDEIVKIEKRGATSQGLFGLGVTLADLKAQRAQVQAHLEAQRQAMRQMSVAVPGAGPSFASDGNITITADPDLFGSHPAAAHKGSTRKDNSREEALERMRRQIEEADKATKDFSAGLQDMRDELSGPLAQALTEHNRKVQELKDLAKEGNTSQADLNAAIEAETALYEKRKKGIEETLNPLAKVIEAQERELALMGLTGAALQTASDLYGATAEQVAKYGAEIAANNQRIEELIEKQNMMDGFKSSAEDAFASFLDRTKSAKEAFGDFVQDMQRQLARLAAQKLIQMLFNSFSSAMGGGDTAGLATTGDFFGSAKGNAFVHGVPVTAFANGGIVNSPTLFPMRHGVGLMGEAGKEAVIPLARDEHGRLGVRGGGGLTQNNYFAFREPVTRRTEQQVAQRTGERSQRALMRNR